MEENPTAEQYAVALDPDFNIYETGSEDFFRRLKIRIGRLGDPLYAFEAWIELKLYQLRSLFSTPIDENPSAE